MKKFSFLAALVLPLFIATAASAGPVVTTTNLTYGVDSSSGIGFSSNGSFISGIGSTVVNGIEVGPITSTLGGVTTTVVPTATYTYNTGLSVGANGVYYLSSANTVSVAVNGLSSVVGSISGTAQVVATGPNTNTVYAISTTGAVTNVLTGAVIATGLPMEDSFLQGQAVVNDSGILFVASYTQNKIFSVTPSGVVSTVASNLLYPEALTLAPNGIDIIVANENANNSSAAQFISITPSGVITNLGALLINGYGYIDLLAQYGGDLYAANENGVIYRISGLGLAGRVTNSSPDTPTNLAAATVGHTTMKLTWNYQTSPTTQFICTASNGATATVTGTSCSLKGFDLYNPGSYSFSVIAVVDGVQSDAAVLSVSVK